MSRNWVLWILPIVILAWDQTVVLAKILFPRRRTEIAEQEKREDDAWARTETNETAALLRAERASNPAWAAARAQAHEHAATTWLAEEKARLDKRTRAAAEAQTRPARPGRARLRIRSVTALITAVALAAAGAGAAVLSGESGSASVHHAAAAAGNGAAAGKPIVVRVGPGSGITVRVPKVGMLAAAKGSFTSPGTMTITTQQRHPAGRGRRARQQRHRPGRDPDQIQPRRFHPGQRPGQRAVRLGRRPALAVPPGGDGLPRPGPEQDRHLAGRGHDDHRVRPDTAKQDLTATVSSYTGLALLDTVIRQALGFALPVIDPTFIGYVMFECASGFSPGLVTSTPSFSDNGIMGVLKCMFTQAIGEVGADVEHNNAANISTQIGAFVEKTGYSVSADTLEATAKLIRAAAIDVTILLPALQDSAGNLWDAVQSWYTGGVSNQVNYSIDGSQPGPSGPITIGPGGLQGGNNTGPGIQGGTGTGGIQGGNGTGPANQGGGSTSGGGTDSGTPGTSASPAPAPQQHVFYDNYGPTTQGVPMCRGNQGNPASVPGGTVTETFTANATGTINSAKVQIDPDSTVTATAVLSVNGTDMASNSEPASGDVVFTFSPVTVRTGDTVSLRISFTATYGNPPAGSATFGRLPHSAERRESGHRAAQDEGGQAFSFPFPCRAVGAAAENQLDESLVDVGCQETDEPVPGCTVLVAEQHVRDLMQGDVGGVEGGGPGLVVDVVGIGGADPQAAGAPGPVECLTAVVTLS